jgi:plasminogen activator
MMTVYRQRVLFRACLSLFFFLLFGMPWSAASAQSVDRFAMKTTTFSERFSAELYAGHLQGQSRELVYDAATGYKISELIWTIDKAYVIGGSVSVRPLDRLTLSIGGWVPISSQNTMDDYDWEVAGFNDWSSWSHHTNTKLDHAYMMDVKAAFRLASLTRQPQADSLWQVNRASLDLLGGYRWYKMSWTAFGGSYISTPQGGTINDLRSIDGDFSEGQRVISYEQWWETPYVGLGGSIGIERWTLSAEVIGSLWARGRDRDDHHIRQLLFEESFSGVPMFGANIGIGCDLTKHLSLFTRVDYQQFYEGKGSTHEMNYRTGGSLVRDGDSAGADFRATIISMGLKLKF